jgi:hypothetical protein
MQNFPIYDDDNNLAGLSIYSLKQDANLNAGLSILRTVNNFLYIK